jgi:polyisoprenoid-binding protein YceI
MKRIALAVLLGAVACAPANADWVLNGEKSAVSFVSTKAINVAEVHRFARLSGGVDGDGRVSISIDLASVDTSIEVRDERMRSMLFNTEEYSAAEVTATVDPDKIAGLAAGESVEMTVECTLSLHGNTRPLMLDLVVTRSGASQLLVVSKKPVVVNAPEFGLGEGVEALREIAGLPSISLAVPVSFVLAFDKH